MKMVIVYSVIAAAVVGAAGDMADMEMPAREEQNPPAAAASMESTWWPGLPMNRDGSGTAWLPDAAAVAALHRQSGKWSAMLHYNAFARYTAQDIAEAGGRGGSAFDGPNWAMGGLAYPLGVGGRIAARTMLSLDILTEGGDGYPLLFQTGETWDGVPLVDRQHPHDLCGELALGYGKQISAWTGVFVYTGLPGEPALGPPAYLHRPAAAENADAPLGHHWEDATHITFGVLTAGAWAGPFKVEGSVFSGREPDEDRYGFDQPRLDSYAGRVTWNPSSNWSTQVSYGLLREPEASHPGHDVGRATASALYSWNSGLSGFDASAVWGMNRVSDGAASHAALLEGCGRRGRWSAFFRGEWVQKSTGDLSIPGENHESLYGVGAVKAGISFRVFSLPAAVLRCGAAATAYRVPSGLTAYYGGTPLSAEVFARISPDFVTSHQGHHHH